MIIGYKLPDTAMVKIIQKKVFSQEQLSYSLIVSYELPDTGMVRMIKKNKTPPHKYNMGDNWLYGSIMEKDLGILVHQRLNRQCDTPAQKVNSILGGINRSIRCKDPGSRSASTGH